MDDFYDHTAGNAALQEWGPCMSDPNAPHRQKLEGGRILKAMLPGTSRRKEAVLTVVGILCNKDLPPVKKNEISPRRIPYARQYAAICGYDTDLFETALNRIAEVGYLMETAVDEGQMINWRADAVHDIYGRMLSSTARYFTMQHDIPDGNKIPFGRFHTKDPAGFRAGDLVEMGFAMIAYRSMADGKTTYTCKLVLRSLILLDRKLSQGAFISRMAAQDPVRPLIILPKRTILSPKGGR
ncbi:hypothetical protein B0H13DRAFT_1877304 [Mycena leptocephala]|nr:hypothetical protein B0H13DRAFT_1877304 [Mycena leptocephala]